MLLLLHAITRAEVPGPGGAGLRGYPLRRVQHGALAAWATLWPAGAARSLERADLFESHELLLRFDDCVPARLPTWVADEAALAEQLAQHTAELAECLERVRGRCELALTVVWRGDAAATVRDTEATVAHAAAVRGKAAAPLSAGGTSAGAGSGSSVGPDAAGGRCAGDADSLHQQKTLSAGEDSPGRRYLLARRGALVAAERQYTRASEVRALLDAAAGQQALEVRHRLCPSPGVALSSALLVPRSVAASVQQRLLASLVSQPDVRILVNGPWPPYTFAGLGTEA